ncbi:MAG: hypothetical protein ACYTFI_15605 [Planctomycetota bacterium]
MVSRACSVVLLIAVGCAVTNTVDAPTWSQAMRRDTPGGDPGWAWVRLWRKAIDEDNLELLSSLALPEADFRVYLCNSKDYTMEVRTVSRAEWLGDVRNLYSSEDDYVKISAAGDSGPVAEIRGWDKAGEWRYSIVASLKDSTHGTMTAAKMGLFRFPPGEP